MTRGKLYKFIAPTITFFLGIVFQALLAQLLPITNPVVIALIAIIFVLALVLTVSLITLSSLERSFEIIEGKLLDIASDIAIRTGLHVEYVEDNFDGRSYKRSTELIEGAKSSLTFVSPWDPKNERESDENNDEIKNAKRKYYEAITKQVSSFLKKILFSTAGSSKYPMDLKMSYYLSRMIQHFLII